MEHYGLAGVYIKQAMRLPGCPICRCSVQVQERYLRFLIWERVDDLETRIRLSQSQGFCANHARVLL